MTLRRRRQTEFTHAVATIVNTHHVRELARHMIHLQHIMKELDDVHNLIGGDTFVLTLEYLWVIHSDVCGT
jgi:hypothetical protein